MLIGLLRTILIIVGIYYLVKFFMWLFMSPAKSSNASSSQKSEKKKKKDGEVTIDYMPDHKKHIRKDSGDYIDYEEVKEE